MFDKKTKWEADAGKISDFKKINSFVYKNGSVNSFLDSSDKPFVIAAKGMGKTLLLSYKRYLYENEDESSSILFVPKQHPYLSFIDSIKSTLSQEHISKLRDWEYCRRFWTLIIELSTISFVNTRTDMFFSDLPERVQRHKTFLLDIVGKQRTIEYVFNEIISLNESTLTKLIDDISNYVSEIFKTINQGIIIFLDRFDNALETSHDDIWIPIQVGLLEAAWNIMRTNTHVKIYLSIRQEAYAAHCSNNMSAASTSVVKIEYSKSELKELVNHLVKFYEGYPSLEEFLGFDSFPNTITFKDENVFDFIFRYSIGRPRDFVQFCGELSTHKDGYSNLEEKRMELKEKIREVSSNTIIGSLYDELRMLMKCLVSSQLFDEFLILLKHNILTYNELKQVCKQFNRNNCTNNCKDCSHDKHPFCDLFNMGLLGFVGKPEPGANVVQKFKTPYENFTNGLRGNVDFFLIHPALREYIKILHRSSSIDESYDLYRGILIGAGLPWTNNDTELYYVNKMISEIRNRDAFAFFNSLLENRLKNSAFRFPVSKYNKLKKEYPIYEQRIFNSLTIFFRKRRLELPMPISIFVSYAYDNKVHKERVESFVEMLRQMGFDATMDSLLKSRFPDIDQMMTYGLSLDKTIIVLSPEYKRKADNSEGGVWKEFKMIASDLEIYPRKYIFVSFDALTESLKNKILPKRIGNRWIVDMEKGRNDNYNELVAFIKEEKEYPFSDVNQTTVSVKPKQIKPF